MKKIIVYLLILSIGFATACGPMDNNIDPKENNEDNINEDNPKDSYEVDNDGGNFSKDDLIYFIMTDRFYDGDDSNNNFPDVNKNDPRAYHGGDLKGVIKKLDYIKSLGVTAIWLTPVVKNEPNGYHGYWALDFYEVDPHLGTMDDLKKLVSEAHKRDMKVILDHVVNHTGYKHPWQRDSEKRDWYHPKKDISNYNDEDQVENGWLAGLPDLNTENPDVKKYLFDNTLWWIDETGVDGMRLDTVRHVPKEFWKEFSHRIKEKYPDFYLLGEVWNNNPRYLELYHEIGIDGLTNYSLYEGIRGTFTRFGKATSLANALKQESNFSNPNINGIFIDNHDNRRLITEGKEYGSEYLKQALTFIMTYPSIPIIYYGTEVGMEGGDDPDNRRDMEWDKIEDSEILKYYKELVDLRKHPSLKTKDITLLDYDNDFISYLRQSNDTSLLVIINSSTKEKEVTINIAKDNDFINLLDDRTFTVSDKKINLSLKPFEILLLESK